MGSGGLKCATAFLGDHGEYVGRPEDIAPLMIWVLLEVDGPPEPQAFTEGGEEKSTRASLKVMRTGCRPRRGCGRR